MSARVTWTKGGEARVVSIGADAIALRSSVPWPPGSRVEGMVQTDGKPIVLRVKVHSSKREGDRDFLLQGRPIDLARDARERLEGRIGTGESED